MQYYALIDWDNTMHRGYTIYGLADHLHAKGIVSDRLLRVFRELEMLYLANAISYSDYTERTCESFARELAGCSAAEYREAVQTFFPVDEPAIFDKAKALFQLLNKYSIYVYLVSGAPFDVLKAYAKPFGIRGIFAFELDIQHHVLTGRVACNYGLNKERILSHPLFRSPDAIHLLSMGDAVADIPLLDNSRIPIIVGDQRLALREGSEPLNYTDNSWNLQLLEERIIRESRS
ncbi:hypothetical protein GCM10008018_12910 [Paenibacillus marchantiophytorum]|uniref:Haloacid dehalogenase-like hydrolase n=1 Tax=Paenibacillus marchantiophytorum TaxID=1619310 RepID=A0ABQ2BT91_9BACL|nr:HAD family hydrolase [Paenibacillus marchantiophytorum]GGI45587.1 hypothetical protein GCM10008018_12910 [Paenibacillus marchantiophytorum]